MCFLGGWFGRFDLWFLVLLICGLWCLGFPGFCAFVVLLLLCFVVDLVMGLWIIVYGFAFVLVLYFGFSLDLVDLVGFPVSGVSDVLVLLFGWLDDW